MSEEAIFLALADRMSTVRWTQPGDEDDARRFITSSRKVRLFSDVSPAAQPACYQAEWGDDEAQVSGMPYKTILGANWIIYQHPGDAVGAIVNNLILDGVRRSLAPLPADVGFQDRRNTLGGLVWHCFISGRIFKDPGDLDGQGMMVVPIKLLIP